MSIWGALGFIALGGVLVGLFDLRAWNMYQKGRRDPNHYDMKK